MAKARRSTAAVVPAPSALLRATQRLAAGEPREALGALLEAWRQRPLDALAGLVDRLDARLAPADVGGDQAAWLAFVGRAEPVDLGAAFASLRGKTVAQTGERVAAAAARGRDPRLAGALVALVREAPFTSDASRPVWSTVLEALVAMGDPRSVPALEAAKDGWAFRKAHRDWLARQVEGALAALREDARTAPVPPTAVEAAELAALTAALTSPEPTAAGPRLLEDLLRDVYERPDDDAPRAVLADLLQERGDPWGELIALQLRPERDPASAAREKKLLAAHAPALRGPLEPVVAKGGLEIARGFPVACRATFRKEADVRAHGAHPAWATVERLAHVVPSPIPADQARWIFWIDPAMRSLREVDVHDASIDCLTGAARPWRIERLDARHVRDRDALDALAATDKLPCLRALVLRDPPRGFVPRMRCAATLRELELSSDSYDPRWDEWLGQAEGVPGLEAFVFTTFRDYRVELRRDAAGQLSRALVVEHVDRLGLLARLLEGLPVTTLTELVVRVVSGEDPPRLAPAARDLLVTVARRQTRLLRVDLTGAGGEVIPLREAPATPASPSPPPVAAPKAAPEPGPETGSQPLRKVRALVWPTPEHLLLLDEGRVARLDLGTGATKTLVEAKGGLLTASAAARLFAVVDGGPVLVADLEGARRHRLDAHMGNGKLLAFSADGRRLLAASGDSSHSFLCLWDVATGRCLSQRPLPDRADRVHWMADEAHVLISRAAQKPLLAPLEPKARGRGVEGEHFWEAARAPSGLHAFQVRRGAEREIVVTGADLAPIARHPLSGKSHSLSFLPGDRLVYVDDDRLLVRPHDRGEARVLLQAKGILAATPSPDGETIAASLGDRIERVPVA